MDQSIVTKLSRKVARDFPEMKGVRPTVRRQSTSKDGCQRYTLTYKGKAVLPGGHKINRIVRVVADERGQIIKISTSK
jgi:hypothetical protein